MKITTALAALACVFSVSTTQLQADLNSDPWQINVYTISSLGSATSAYSGASFGGIAASGGSANLNGLGLNTSGVSSTYAMYTKGTLNLANTGSYNGGISSGGNLTYNSTSTVGNVISGGDLNGNSGSILGNVTLGGNDKSGRGLITVGTVKKNATVSESLNFGGISSYFQNASNYWSGLKSSASWTNVYGQIVVSDLQAGRNVVNLSLADLNSSYGIKLTGPADAFVVFNITDTSGALKNVSYNFSGGINIADVVFNLPNSTSLSLIGGTYASVLAPSATVNYTTGILQGNLVANNLLGSGSVVQGAFSGFAADQSNFVVSAPEPSTYLMMATFLGIALFLKRRQVKA